eukprot:Phypoly_transcript_22485.p1 GENE.Phypoly_transcript_22485~~Phypoly_transcript_22485.p1  ORF type:complete len:159 (+),score=19.93 Phypoly_transcript_22485:52-528(+)
MPIRDMNISVFGAGTTSLVSSYLGNEGYTKKVELAGEPIRLAILDIQGQNEKSDCTLLIQATQGFVITYQISSKTSFEQVTKLVETIQKVKSKDIREIPTVLVGLDLEAEKRSKREVTNEQGKNLAESLGSPFFETSVSAGVNVSEPFLEVARRYMEL